MREIVTVRCDPCRRDISLSMEKDSTRGFRCRSCGGPGIVISRAPPLPQNPEPGLHMCDECAEEFPHRRIRVVAGRVLCTGCASLTEADKVKWQAEKSWNDHKGSTSWPF
jgi:hypothetical protein